MHTREVCEETLGRCHEKIGVILPQAKDHQKLEEASEDPSPTGIRGTITLPTP